ncbi:unnamed protein product [Gongylonema pulchrum]|uniref:Anaphase-promoting complex subunit 13 n=1 Tax=Gongylonema pulchrum TaxID=637853 RepID=A0A183DQ98_9BILA|nr:unnamed protein product [Gongylonema pulchrum]
MQVLPDIPLYGPITLIRIDSILKEHERLYGNGVDISTIPDLDPFDMTDFYKTKESIRVISMSLPIPKPYEYERRRMLSRAAAPPSAQNVSQGDGLMLTRDEIRFITENLEKMWAERAMVTTASPSGARPRNE